jgi:hypothetical protein
MTAVLVFICNNFSHLIFTGAVLGFLGEVLDRLSEGGA